MRVYKFCENLSESLKDITGISGSKVKVNQTAKLFEKKEYFEDIKLEPRGSGLDFDNKFESVRVTTEGILSIINQKMKLDLFSYDIDIAHRLGKYKVRAKYQTGDYEVCVETNKI